MRWRRVVTASLPQESNFRLNRRATLGPLTSRSLSLVFFHLVPLCLSAYPHSPTAMLTQAFARVTARAASRAGSAGQVRYNPLSGQSHSVPPLPSTSVFSDICREHKLTRRSGPFRLVSGGCRSLLCLSIRSICLRCHGSRHHGVVLEHLRRPLPPPGQR